MNAPILEVGGIEEMTVGTCVSEDALTLNRVVGDVADDVASNVSELVVTPVSDMEVGGVLVGITIVTTVFIREPVVGLAVKVSVTGDTMLDAPVGIACVVEFVARGNSREADVEDELLGITLLPEIDVGVETVELLELLELLKIELLELELPKLELLELELVEEDVEEGIGAAGELVG